MKSVIRVGKSVTNLKVSERALLKSPCVTETCVCQSVPQNQSVDFVILEAFFKSTPTNNKKSSLDKEQSQENKLKVIP